MGIAYKNFWSLNTDEAVVTGILRHKTNKNTEVFMPTNAQMKDIDLILMNVKTKKIITLQVKGSRAYEPTKSEIRRFGAGSAGWYLLKKKTIFENTADFFIFLTYVIEERLGSGRRKVLPHIIALPTKKLQQLCRNCVIPGRTGRYNLIIWINPDTKKAFHVRYEGFDVSEYLDKKGIVKLEKSLK